MRIFLMKLLLIISSLSMSASLYANNKPVWEHWSANETTTTPTDGYRTDTADFNQDGHPDMIVVSLDDDKLSVYINDGSGQFTTVVSADTTGIASLREVAVGELDGNTSIDFVVVDAGNDAVYLYKNDGATPTPAFTRTTLPTDIEAPNAPQSVRLADIDGINGLDILVSSQVSSDDIYLYLNDGAGNFTQTHAYTDSTNPLLFDIAVADLDGDNKLDIITADLTGTNDNFRNFWLKGNGDGTFVQQDTYSDGLLENASVDSADFNGDGYNDIFAVSKTQVYWFENDGTGTFTKHQINSVNLATISGVQGNVVDLDGDGDIDALVGRGTTVLWYENDGSGTFTEHTVSANLTRSYSVDSADFDGDGRVDLSVVDREDGELYWFKNMAKFSVAENTTAAGTVKAVDIDSDTLVYSISAGVDTANADAAKFTINTSTGALTFKNAPDYESPDDSGSNRVYNITVNVNDGTADVTMPVEVTVTNIDDHAPVITEGASKSVTMSENGSPTAFSLTLNATDDDNDALTWSISSSASHGTASVSGTGLSKAISYAPTANYDGTDSFVVKVSDSGNGGTDTITVNVTIENVNSLPTANAQSVNLAEDTAKSVTLSGSDSDGTIANYFASSPSKGTLSGTAPNLTYTPNANYNGSDSFTFSVTDNDNGASTWATVSITVTAVNDLPSANTQAVSVAEDSSVNISLTGSDSDGSIASYAVGTPANGSLSGTAPNLIYTPNANYNGNDSFAFTVTDNDGGKSTSATVSITVTSVNDLPSANAKEVSSEEDNTVNITLTGADSDGSIASYTLGSPSNGSLSGTAPNVTYTPNTDYNGNDSFTFSVTDNDGGTSVEEKVDIVIDAVNDTPAAEDDTATFDKNGINQYSVDVLSNDSDVEEDALNVTSANADIGSVTVENNQLILSVPSGFIGSLSVTYLISDGNGGTDSATATVTINGLFDELTPQITLPEDIVINATGLLTKVDLGVATAIDANGNPLPVSLLDDSLMFAPGVSKAYWQSIDVDGNESISAQNVQVHPLISIGKDQTVAEGNTVTVNFYLNGTSPNYPVIVPYSVSGTAIEGEDHSLLAGEIEIGKANVASLTFEVYDDGITDNNEDVVISLSDTVNISPQSVQVVTLYEGNIAPAVSLTAIQQGENRALLSQSDGQVTINASITDQNVTDTHTLLWSSTSDELNRLVNAETTEQISFNAEALSVGTHKLTVLVTDFGEPALTTEAAIYLQVASTLPTLTDVDTDGDLIPDSQEGYSDTDGDGIADYLDAISDCSIMPEIVSTQVTYLIEGEPGVCLRRGSASSDTQSGSLLLTLEETIQAVGEDEAAEIVGGIFDYIVYGLENPGQKYKLVLPQRQPIPAGAIYRKYTDVAGWSNFVEDANNQLFSTQGEPGFCPPPGSADWQAGLTEGHWCVQLNIADGGPNDNDGIANGTIVDPGGVAVYLSSNTAPMAENDTITTIWNEEVEIDVLANDSDIDGDTLTVLNATAKFGTVNVISNASLSYTPQVDYVGMETITYIISDGNGGIASADVSIEVIGNRAPVANNDSASTDDRTSITIDVLSNDTDADDDVLTLQSVSAVNGSVIIVDNSIQYTPTIGFDENDIVTYIVVDDKGGESEGTVDISVQAYESITVVNESTSSGGSFGSFTLLLLPLLLLRRVKNIKLLHLVLLAFLVASMSAKADWGIVGSIGQASADVSKAELNNKLANQYAEVISIDDTDTSWSLGVSYQFSNHWFIDASYLELGEFSTTIEGITLDPEDFQQNSASILPTNASGFTLGGGYQYDINDRWFLVANTGLFSWKSDYKSSGPTTLTSSQSSIDLYYGVGVGVQLMENVKISLSYTHYNLDNNDVNTTALAINYRF